jgi:glycosyltransferase involved in cell wall biosynthesis
MFLLDPYLIDYSGHCYNYLNFLKVFLSTKQHTIQLIGNELCATELASQNVRPLFSKSLLDPVKHKISRSAKLFVRHYFKLPIQSEVSLFRDDFDNVFKILAPKQDDVIFLNSLRPGQFLGLVEWMIQSNQIVIPKIIVVLHFTSRIPNWSGKVFAWQYRQAFALAKNNQIGNSLTVFADTDLLVDEFKNLGAEVVSLAPIPTALAPEEASHINPQLGTQEERTTITIAFIGQARKDKGFQHLPDIITHIQPLIQTGVVRVKIQVGPTEQLSNELLLITKELSQLGAIIIDRSLKPEEYFQFLNSSDVVLLPYRGAAYNSQSSGIFSEALASGKIVLAARNSWMGHELNLLGLPTFVERDSGSAYAKMLEKIIFDFDFYKDKFKKASHSWREKQSFEKFTAYYFTKK